MARATSKVTDPHEGSALTWEEPSKRTSGRVVSDKYVEIQNELRAHLGEWAVIAYDMKASTLTGWRKGGSRWTPGEFEFRARDIDPETGVAARVYGRAVDPDAQDGDAVVVEEDLTAVDEDDLFDD